MLLENGKYIKVNNPSNPIIISGTKNSGVFGKKGISTKQGSFLK